MDTFEPIMFPATDPGRITMYGRRIAVANRRNPSDAMIGLFFQPMQRVGGAGFLWFEDQNALASCLTEDLPLFCCALDGKRTASDMTLMGLRRALYCNGGLDLSIIYHPTFKMALSTYGFQITWYGSFGDLTSDEGLFARDVRQKFRDLLYYPYSWCNPDSPIEPRERARFRKFLHAYRPK